MDKKIHFSIWYIFLALWGVILLHDAVIGVRKTEHIPYSQFLQLLEEKKIKSVAVGQNQITGTMQNVPEGAPDHFVTVRLEEPDLIERLQKGGVEFSGIIETSFFRDVLAWVLPVLVFFGVWSFLIRRMASREGIGGQLVAIGKSRAKIYVEEETKVSFKDVAGADEAKQELEEIVDFLKNPKAYSRLGGRLPKGVLLIGPPGTGKTLFARAVAGEAGVPFFSISGSEFVEMFVGVGAARVRDLFEQARQKAPCIIFIDELDALGRARGLALPGGGSDEKEQTLNQLLVEMDGFDPTLGVVLLAASNRPEILDPALLRAGRFDRQVVVERPDKQGRVKILEIHTRTVVMAPGVNLEEIAALTPGFSGADLANLVNEAALLATRRRAEAVDREDFLAAVERVVAGLEKRGKIITEQEKRIVAYHEMGHALVALSLPGSGPIVKVSVIPRGMGALGYTIQRPTDDRYLLSASELKDKMTVLLGGRASETLVFEDVSTGAQDDISRATEIARDMVMRFGMEKTLGQVSYESEPRSFLERAARAHERLYSEQTAREIDLAVKARVAEAFDSAVKILQSLRSALEEGVKRLLAQETLSQEELQSIFTSVRERDGAGAPRACNG